MNPVQFGAAQVTVNTSVFNDRKGNPVKAQSYWEAVNTAKDTVTDRTTALPDGVTLEYATGFPFYGNITRQRLDQLKISFATTDGREFEKTIRPRRFLSWDLESPASLWQRGVEIAETAVKAVGAKNVAAPDAEPESTLAPVEPSARQPLPGG